jgi:hypothetical protein
VSDGAVRSHGRLTLLATPSKVRNLHRVSLPSQQNLARGDVPHLIISGT